MKLVKCKKCGATVMTVDTLLANVQEEYNALVKKSHRVKGADKQIINQQLSYLKKMAAAICHSSSESEIRKNNAYNELFLLRKHLVSSGLMDYETLNKIRDKAREITKEKIAEDEKVIAALYGDLENHFYNNTKSDPTATAALKGGVE